MPLIEYDQDLGVEGDVVWIRIRTERGRMVDFVVQHETAIGDRMLPVVRYDGSHGRAHRDLLDGKGRTVRKKWLPSHLTFDEALIFGQQDIEGNWRTYRDAFLRRLR